jgi:NADPH:quinone reductase-like Zn-dependent oxidoreductase
VIEHVGPTVWQSCLASLAKGGRLVTCGATTGPEVRFDVRYLFSRQLKVNGSYLGPRVELVHAARVLGQRKVKAVIDRVFALAEARAAQEAMLGRRFFGKLVLAIH